MGFICMDRQTRAEIPPTARFSLNVGHCCLFAFFACEMIPVAFSAIFQRNNASTIKYKIAPSRDRSLWSNKSSIYYMEKCSFIAAAAAAAVRSPGDDDVDDEDEDWDNNWNGSGPGVEQRERLKWCSWTVFRSSIWFFFIWRNFMEPSMTDNWPYSKRWTTCRWNIWDIEVIDLFRSQFCSFSFPSNPVFWNFRIQWKVVLNSWNLRPMVYLTLNSGEEYNTKSMKTPNFTVILFEL